MRKGLQASIASQFHALYSVGTFAGLSDAQLLERFAAHQGEGAELAFAAIVERHGPMVFRVCRRVLRNPDDAQDAFQATFLVLVRKANALKDTGSFGNWLYGVATRVALDARASRLRRERIERNYADRPVNDVREHELPANDLEVVLHEELRHLPERYRAPVVLCCLEGLSHEEAALRLDRPLGTVRSRLARGKERLRRRLFRRGVFPTIGGLTTLLSGDASAAVPEGVFDLTVKAAAHAATGRAISAEAVSAAVTALIQGELRAMLFIKLKYAVVLITAFGTAAAGAAVYAFQDDPTAVAKQAYRPENLTKQADPTAPTKAEPRPSTRTANRVVAAQEHLAQTKTQVDSAVKELRGEVADLQARLEQAQDVLRRMEALQAALSDERHISKELPQAKGDFTDGGYGREKGAKPNRAPSDQKADPSANAKPASPETQKRAELQPEDFDKAESRLFTRFLAPGDGNNLPRSKQAVPDSANRRQALDDEIRRLTEERNRLDGGLDRPQKD
jgi:RNA polymerase sigma factor (sigma-70 family)